MGVRTGITIAAVVLLAGGEGAAAACRDAAPNELEGSVRWVSAGPPEDASRLAPWCAAVGGPLLTPGQGPAPRPPLDSLAVVVWNVHVGAGAIESLVAELRSGGLSGGRPVAHFVLLLQEVVRVGGSVPEFADAAAVSASPIGAPVDAARSFESLALRTGLAGFYAPSMRNGAEHREDRGNAILSTLPLQDPVAIELPHERQRRVAVSARVEIPFRESGPTALRLVSAHLDNASGPARFWRSFGTGRAHQARALLEVLDGPLDGDETVVLGGDLNTWYGEAEEPAVELLRQRFPWPPRIPAQPTYSPPYGLPERQVDYLLLRLPDGWEGRYRVDEDRRRSDHSPLIGWLGPSTSSGDVAASEDPS